MYKYLMAGFIVVMPRVAYMYFPFPFFLTITPSATSPYR